MSLYQLLYLDSVPDSAAVNEAVKLTRQMKASSASGFVNAVLRSFIRDEKKIPTVRGNRLKKLEVQYSCPQWLIKILLDSYGEQQTVALLEHSLERPPLYARVNTTRTSAQHCIELLQQQGVQVQQEEALTDCLRLNATASIERLQAFEQGLFYIQDKSSQMCAASLEAQPGERIWTAVRRPDRRPSPSHSRCRARVRSSAVTSLKRRSKNTGGCGASGTFLRRCALAGRFGLRPAAGRV